MGGGVGWDVDVPATCLGWVWGGGWGGMLTSPLPAYLWFGLGLDVDVVVNHLQGWAGVGGGVGC